MLNKLTLSAVTTAILVTLASSAVAAPRNHETTGSRLLVNNMTGAELFQNTGLSESMGYTYKAR